MVRGRKGEYYQLLYAALNKGFSHIYLNGEKHSLREQIILSKNQKHEIDLVVDEIALDEFSLFPVVSEERLAEAVEKALEESEGLVKIIIGDEIQTLSSKFSCPLDGFSFPEVEPRLFFF